VVGPPRAPAPDRVGHNVSEQARDCCDTGLSVERRTLPQALRARECRRAATAARRSACVQLG